MPPSPDGTDGEAVAAGTIHASSSRDDVPQALAAYEQERRPVVESTQRAAAVSLDWFENTERYFGQLEPMQFAYSLRSIWLQQVGSAV